MRAWSGLATALSAKEEVSCQGGRHSGAHAFRTEDVQGVKDFARGCMRTYLILKDKASHFAADAEIQGLLAEIGADDGSMGGFSGAYAREKAAALKAHEFDRRALGARGMQYERLDLLVNELLLGVC